MWARVRCWVLGGVLTACYTGSAPSTPPPPSPPVPAAPPAQTHPEPAGGFAQPPPSTTVPSPASLPTTGPECSAGCPSTAPLYPTQSCADGIHIGGRGPCVRFASGCNWSHLACPAATSRRTCKPTDCDLPTPSAWLCPDRTSVASFTCVPTDAGGCGATYQRCPPVATAPPPSPPAPPSPPPRANPCDPLPSDKVLATWPIASMCSPGGGPDPGDVRPIKDLADGTHILAANGRCVRARFRQCFTKCLPPDTRIATPAGDIAIRDVLVGTEIWTRDADGRRISAPVVDVSRVEVTGVHHVAHLVLGDGRTLSVSPEHPALGTGAVQDLRVGDSYDGSPIVTLELEPYTGARTHDVLPAGATGIYWADGVPLRSTLGPRR